MLVGFVTKEEDWKYSSACDFCGMKGLVALNYVSVRRHKAEEKLSTQLLNKELYIYLMMQVAFCNEFENNRLKLIYQT